MSIVFEDNIPIPIGSGVPSKFTAELRADLPNMQVGQSFVTDTKRRDVVLRVMKEFGYVGTTRTLPDKKKVRVWRLEAPPTKPIAGVSKQLVPISSRTIDNAGMTVTELLEERTEQEETLMSAYQKSDLLDLVLSAETVPSTYELKEDGFQLPKRGRGRPRKNGPIELKPKYMEDEQEDEAPTGLDYANLPTAEEDEEDAEPIDTLENLQAKWEAGIIDDEEFQRRVQALPNFSAEDEEDEDSPL